MGTLDGCHVDIDLENIVGQAECAGFEVEVTFDGRVVGRVVLLPRDVRARWRRNTSGWLADIVVRGRARPNIAAGRFDRGTDCSGTAAPA